MSRPLRVEFEGAFYHITARGNEKKQIFDDDIDREEFLNLLWRISVAHGVIVYAYVLMYNHYHFLIETLKSNLTKFMHTLQTVYTNRYNRRHNRIGHLFQGRYKSILVEKEAYLLELNRYIHLNPVRAGIVNSPEEFKWSSYRCYLGLKKNSFINTDWLLSQFNNRDREQACLQYKTFVEKGITKKIKNPLEDTYAGFVLGSKSFTKSILENIKDKEISSEIPFEINQYLNLKISDIKEVVLKEYGIKEEDLFRRRSDAKPLKIALYLARKLTDFPIGTITKELGNRHYSFVSHSVKDIEEEKNRDEDFKRLLEKIENEVRTNSQFKT